MFINNKTATLGAMLLPASLFAQQQQQERPNILIIQCDHLSQRVIDRYGETIGLTPVIDSLASTGVVFQDAYVACPLSQPSRAGLWSGTLPHINGVRSNSALPINSLVSEQIPTLGELFSAAGYDAVHFGKTHDMGALRGFDHTAVAAETFDDLNYPVNQDSFRDVVTTRKVVDYLSNKKEGDAPFICIADMINPHNICGYVGAFAGKYEDESSVPAIYGELPELPANFEIEDWDALPLPLQYLCCTHSRLTQAAHWTPLQYRHYVAAFRYYCKMVCAQLEEIMAALHSTPEGANTIIVLTADHGDGMASHRMVSKHASFYEEMTNVPLIISGANIKSQKANVGGLASVTLDLLPTLCGLAGIDIPADKTGTNWAPMLTGKGKIKGHDYVVSEWHTEYEYAVTPGRMIRSKDYKYVHYLEGDGEQLFDLRSDKGEMQNLVKNPKYSKVLERHRKLLKDHVEATADDYFSLKVEVDPRCRAHEAGYHNHVGDDNARSYSKQKRSQLVFSDDCTTTSWRDNWFLDGEQAKVSNSAEGLVFESGKTDATPEVPEYHAAHAVLWSNQTFEDGITIKYDFMRTDEYEGLGIVLSYVLAEGYEEGGLPTDIKEWSADRKVPYMRSYFRQMSLAHISYATSLDEEEAYIRSRVYPQTAQMEFSDMEVTPSYDNKGLFKPNEWYSIEIQKIGDALRFFVTKDGKTYPFAWEDARYAELKSGRIGFRQMANRSSIYKNIRVYQSAK